MGRVFAIASPCLNAVETIDEAIQSVVTQAGEFRIRFHAEDGGSDDGTLERLEHWQQALQGDGWPWVRCDGVEFTYSVAADDGPQHALNSAFGRLSGDVYTWLGGDDRLEAGALQTVDSLLSSHPQVGWVTGAVSLLHEDGVLATTDPAGARPVRANVFPRELVAAGFADARRAPLIQQEGTFWTDEIWTAVGRRVRTDLDLAFDFELWIRLAAQTDPVTVVGSLGRFRRREGQLSQGGRLYRGEIEAVQAELAQAGLVRPIKAEHGLVALSKAGGGWSLHEAPGDGGAAVQLRLEDSSEVGWTAVEGVTEAAEGPFPELGLDVPFHWLTGALSVVRLWPQSPGWHAVRIALRNPHPNQSVRITGPALDLRLAVTVSSVPEAPWEVEFPLYLPAEGAELSLEFAETVRPAGEDRELSAILLSMEGAAA